MTQKEQERREFWRQQMDEGNEFMESVKQYPVEECCEKCVSLQDAVDSTKVEVMFSDSDIIPGTERQFYLRTGLIPHFLAAANEMNDRGFVMKVEDAYRSRAMQKGLALMETLFDAVVQRLLWEHEGRLPPLPALVKRLGVLIASCPKTGTHMSGSALDISVFDRANGSEIDRGAPYLELSDITSMSSPFIDSQCRSNRIMITEIMRKHHFIEYPYEFWHYSSGDAIAELVLQSGKPVRYGPVDINPLTNEVTSIEHPTEPLNSDNDIQAIIRRRLV